MGTHLIDGKFQSDKYPTCPAGKVPLSTKDVTAQDLLWEYAQRRRPVDAEFSEDLEIALRADGFNPNATFDMGTHSGDDVCPSCSKTFGAPVPCAITHDFGPGAYDFAAPAPTVSTAASVLDERPLTLDAAIAHLEAYAAAQRGKEEPTIEHRDRATVALAALVPRLLVFLRGQERAEPTFDRDSLGRLVREVWVAWAREQANPKPAWLVPWEELSEFDREVDRRIGEKLFAEGRRSVETAPLTERLNAAIEALRVWLNNADPADPIEDMHELVVAFDAWKEAATLTETEADAWARRTIPAPAAIYYRRAIGAALLASNRGAIPTEVRASEKGDPLNHKGAGRVSMRVRCPVCPYLATGGMGRAGDPCPNGDGGVLVTDTSRGAAAPVPRSVEGQPAGVIGDVWMRWNGLAASPLRTDAEEAELAHLGAMLVAVGLETWEPVPREPLPPYPGDEDPAEDPRPT